jgi:uncharacterized protein YraI
MELLKRLSILGVCFLYFAAGFEAFADTVRVTSRKGVNFRSKPQGRDIGGIPAGAELEILETRGKWVQVMYNGKKGWIYTPRATRVTVEEKPATPETQTAEADTGAVNIDLSQITDPPIPQPRPIEEDQTATEEEPQDTQTADHHEGDGHDHDHEHDHEELDVEDLPDPVAPKAGKPSAMRYDSVASSGQCLIGAIKTDEQAKSLLKYYEINAPGSTAEERINLAQGLYQASALYGGRMSQFVGATIEFSSRKGLSRYCARKSGSKCPKADVVQLNRCNKWGDKCGANANINTARLMHELAHRFGHKKYSGNTSYYDYFAANLRGCHPTGYADNNNAENVAEAVAAFLTHPERLSAGSKKCQRVFEFLSTKVFEKNGPYASCNPTVIAALDKRILGLDGSNNVSVASVYTAIFNPPARSEEVVTASRTTASETRRTGGVTQISDIMELEDAAANR